MGLFHLGVMLRVAALVGARDPAGIEPAGPVPGRSGSAHFAVSAKAATASGATAACFGDGFVESFVLETTSKGAGTTVKTGYFAHLTGWTSSWTSVMLGEANSAGVLLRITPLLNASLGTTAVIRPARAPAELVAIQGGVACVLVTGPARFTVSFQGGLEDTDTGPGYKGPPVHTFSAFVNPHLAPPAGLGVVTVTAGNPIPSPLPAGTTALVFGPGEHRMAPTPANWSIYTLPQAVAAVRIYVPVDAVLYFAMHSAKAPTHTNLTIEGYGALSGEEMDRCLPGAATELEGGSCANNSPEGLLTTPAGHDGPRSVVSVRGITLIDFPNHHVIAGAGSGDSGCSPALISAMTNVKVMGWRANGDGIHVFGAWLVKDCFLRTQDDSIYLSSSGAKNHHCPSWYEGITTWNDANGAAYMLIGYGNTLIASDSIYQRSSWAWWSGGRVLTNRQQGTTVGVTVDDLVASDPFPYADAINLNMQPGSESGSDHPGPSTVMNVTIRNLHVRAFSTQRTCPKGGANGEGEGGCACVPACGPGALPLGIPNVLTGGPVATNNITSLSFINCTIGGQPMAEVLLGPGFNVTWDAVADITADGKKIRPPE